MGLVGCGSSGCVGLGRGGSRMRMWGSGVWKWGVGSRARSPAPWLTRGPEGGPCS